MQKQRILRRAVLCLLVGLGALGQRAAAQSGNRLLGGPRGVVRSARGELLEGIMVQLISPKSAMRTTVSTNVRGQYEFPKLEAGLYTLRIARPLEFQPYVKESVRIDAATPLEEIVLDRVTDSDLLPPTPEIAAQLTGAEWMMNLPGTGEQKKLFGNSCGYGCHSYQQIFLNRYDERSWRLVLDRMTKYAGSLIANPAVPPRPGEASRSDPVNYEVIAKWLSTVRGPESKDAPLVTLPRAFGPATRVIVTEYELPRLELAPHDVTGDAQGNIWYTSHRTPWLGRLDPRTGAIQEYFVPPMPGVNPGTHGVVVDKDGTVLLSENWSHRVTRLDPRTGKFTQVSLPEGNVPLNSPAFGNFSVAPDGYIWMSRDGAIVKIDPKTGESVPQHKLKKVRGGAYGNELNADGTIFAGGVSAGFVIYLNMKTGELYELETHSRTASPAKGGIDPQGNAWFGGRGGSLVKFDAKTHQLSEYPPPTQYTTFYEALPDKNGEVWAGELHGGRIVRFNPRADKWIEYVLPEPYSHNRRTWIDNSTDPVAVWYVDHNGYMVRLQPLD